jgi:hypothetical protein
MNNDTIWTKRSKVVGRKYQRKKPMLSVGRGLENDATLLCVAFGRG